MTSRLEELLAEGRLVRGAALGACLAAVWCLTSARCERPRWAAYLAVGLSVNAALWLYACLPDTESARALVGAVIAGGVVVLLTGRSWSWPAGATSAVLAYTSLSDGAPRPSAVIGGVGIAAIHVVAQLPVVRDRPWWRLLAVVPASATCARVAGLGSGRLRSVAVVTVAVASVVVVLLPGTSRSRRSGHPR